MTQLQPWHNDVVLEFIEHYRNEQLLWDPKHPHHKNKAEVNEAWERIQSGMSIQCSVVELKKKKESLMTSFRMHYRRKQAAYPKEYRISWFAYPLMESFLGDVYVPECSKINTEPEYYPSSSEHQYAQNIQNTSMERNPLPTTPATVRKHRYPQQSVNKSPETSYKKPFNASASYDRNDMDECELYGQLLAKKLRRLDEHQRDVAMHEIDNIIFRVKMSNGPSQQPQSTSYISPVPRKMKSPIFVVSQPNHEQYEEDTINYQQNDPIQEESS